jgi:hypothetical protein
MDAVWRSAVQAAVYIASSKVIEAVMLLSRL